MLKSATRIFKTVLKESGSVKKATIWAGHVTAVKIIQKIFK